MEGREAGQKDERKEGKRNQARNARRECLVIIYFFVRLLSLPVFVSYCFAITSGRRALRAPLLVGLAVYLL